MLSILSMYVINIFIDVLNNYFAFDYLDLGLERPMSKKEMLINTGSS